MTDLSRRRAIRDPRQWWLWVQGLFGARYDGLAHFAVVEPGALMRAGQPRLRDLDYIRQTYGLKTIIAARGGTRHPLRGRWFRAEQNWCAQHGVQLVHLPFSDLSVPPAETFDRAVQIFQDPARRPVLVHCEQGFHRTGVLCAAYRLTVSKWDLERTLEEMQRRGYHPDDEKRRALYDAFRHWADRAVA